ncbi:MAG: hypothetical protein AAFR49_18750, partial [Pseudomonadota bacterium]
TDSFVDMTVEFVARSGGCGKTSLGKMLSGVWMPQRGDVQTLKQKSLSNCFSTKLTLGQRLLIRDHKTSG